MGDRIMKRSVALFLTLSFSMAMPLVVSADGIDPARGEKELLAKEFKSVIPKDRYKAPEELYKKLQEIKAGTSKAVIIDVRSEEEFDSGHIEGAVNIDFGRAILVPAQWPDPKTEIWVNCRMKHRSTYFTGLLYKFGYRNVYLVDGGIGAWANQGYPIVNKYLGEFVLTNGGSYINQKE